MNISTLEKKTQIIRQEVVRLAYEAGKAHLGGTLSCVDLLTVLYHGRILKVNLQKPEDPNRDRFILSKGHACLALYAIFKNFGFISGKKYRSYGKDGGLGGQLDTNISGVDFNTGSLGHAAGVAAGMAEAARYDRKKYKVYVLVGDAELYEGSMWEAIIFTTERKLNNIVVIIDRNRLSVTTHINEGEGPYLEFQTKIKSFGWAYEEVNGHDLKDLTRVFKKVANSQKPVIIMAHTIKGKGVSFMENDPTWHHGSLSREAYEKAIQELN